mmetsp:Transcript_106709/g.299849  ORF Transcript_106709/g.299849 Transcript_106709/m.299849 type:complete len:254 (+) Transcript_106709:105-866(+)
MSCTPNTLARSHNPQLCSRLRASWSSSTYAVLYISPLLWQEFSVGESDCDWSCSKSWKVGILAFDNSNCPDASSNSVPIAFWSFSRAIAFTALYPANEPMFPRMATTIMRRCHGCGGRFSIPTSSAMHMVAALLKLPAKAVWAADNVCTILYVSALYVSAKTPEKIARPTVPGLSSATVVNTFQSVVLPQPTQLTGCAMRKTGPTRKSVAGMAMYTVVSSAFKSSVVPNNPARAKFTDADRMDTAQTSTPRMK